MAAYLTPIAAIILLYLKPYRSSVFVRFHAFQSIIVGIVALALVLLGALFASLGWTCRLVDVWAVVWRRPLLPVGCSHY